jgi:uridine kinase
MVQAITPGRRTVARKGRIATNVFNEFGANLRPAGHNFIFEKRPPYILNR